MSYWIFVGFIIYVELFSIGVTVAAYRRGCMKHPALCMIPFVAFFAVDRLVGDGFKIAGIVVKKWGITVPVMTAVCLLSYAYAAWGERTLNIVDAECLVQIMYVPVAVCAIVFWLGTVSSTCAVLFKFRARFKFDWLVSLLLITAPVLLIVCTKQGSAVEARRKKC